MGGGDLNLKKSWHPSTMKNMEKVWKAEQQQNHEEKRIAELKKELRMEKDREDIKKYAMDQGVIEKKDDKKLDWMYKGPNQLVNREDYLLGRPIDKSFEQMVQSEKETEQTQVSRNHVEHECIPPSLRFFSGNEQVDLVRKMQEDPLYAIKKKELETRNQLLKNPVKLKQLKQLLEEQSKSKREKKQKKKHKNLDSDDEAELDMLLTSKYMQLKDKISDQDLTKSMKKIKHKSKKKSNKKGKDSSESESEESLEESIKRSKKKKRSRENSVQSRKYNEETYIKDTDKEDIRKHRRLEEYKDCSSSRRRSISPNYKRRDKPYKSREKVYCPRSPRHRDESTNTNRYNNRNEIADKYSSNKSDNKDRSNSKMKKVLTEEEKEKRRQQMIANATWRDKEREKNVKKYCEEEKKEIDSGKVYNQDFIRKQLAAAAEVGTVATRIKANINNIQRSGRAMDSNFAKR